MKLPCETLQKKFHQKVSSTIESLPSQIAKITKRQKRNYKIMITKTNNTKHLREKQMTKNM